MEQTKTISSVLVNNGWSYDLFVINMSLQVNDIIKKNVLENKHTNADLHRPL